MYSLAPEIVKRLKNFLPEGRDLISLHEPSFVGNEKDYVNDCIESGWVSYAGDYVQKFDAILAKRCGIKHAVCVSNGTIALFLALKVAGVEAGDELLMPSFTFVATANAASHLGATPHFVDNHPETLGLDPEKLNTYLEQKTQQDSAGFCRNKETGSRITAIIPVHVFGHPCHMDEILALATKYNLKVITDAAESLGSEYKEKPASSYGDIATLSFNGNKIVTTGGGGAVLTNNDTLAERLKHLSTTAKVKHAWRFMHDEIGYNFRLPNLNAALGCAGLETLDQTLRHKRKLAADYQALFADLEGLSVFEEPGFAKSNYWLNAILLEQEDVVLRDTILEIANENGIMTRPAWDLMHTLPMYKDHPRMNLETSENLVKRIINIPSSSFLVRD